MANKTQVRGLDFVEEHESISKAKRFTRTVGRCVVLEKEDCGQGEQEFGFFHYAGEQL
jgi:hypothetical protein